MTPLVSVVIPCFNAEETIVRALTSVTEQHFKSLEIIVVDDGSEDRSVEIVRGLGLSNLVLAESPGRAGASAARNRGIALSKGEFVAFLDADDEWLPDKLQAQLDALRARPEAVFASARCLAVEEGTQREFGLYEGLEPRSGRDVWRTLLAYNFVGTPSVLVRREALVRVGPFDERLHVAEDQDLWIRLSMIGELVFLDRPLVRVYLRSKSLSNENMLWRLENELTMVRKHVDALGPRLSRAERRNILGTRFSRVGRHLYLSYPTIGLRLLLKAILYRKDVLRNSTYILTSSRPALFAKNLIRPFLRNSSIERTRKMKL